MNLVLILIEWSGKLCEMFFIKRRSQILVSLLAISICAGQANADGPTITVFRGLTFGMSLGGTNNTVAPTDPNAAAFEIQVPGLTFNQYAYGDIQVAIILPYSLTSGSNSLSVSYGANSGARNTTNSFSGCTYFNPSSGYYSALTADTPFTMYVWLGGTAQPGGSWQPVGDYTGVINVSVTVRVDNPSQNYTVQQSIPVDASVIQGLSMTISGSLDFGRLLTDETPNPLNAQTNPNAPLITVAGTGASQITVTYNATTSLTDGHGHSLTFSPGLCGSNLPTSQTTSTPVGSNAKATLSGSRGYTGFYYFWLGGGLNFIPQNQAPGDYSGTFTLTVTYLTN